VLRLVQRNLDISREPHPDPASEVFVRRVAGELDPLRPELGDGRVELVADEPELMLRLAVGRVDAELGRR
jgi:hypothetical protein